MKRVKRDIAFDRLAFRLSNLGLPTQWYIISDYKHLRAITGNETTEVSILEACLGPSANKQGYSAYAVVLTFHPTFSNLALTLLVDLHDTERQPSADSARFSIGVDKKYSTIFLPAVYSAFNDLDPAGRNRSLLVQSYNSEMTLSDFLQASIYTSRLLLRYKHDGQLALIAVDYYDPLSAFIASMMQFTQHIFGGDVHLISRTQTLSSLKIPIRKPDGGYHFIENSSTALDEGFAVAFAYLEKHHQASRLTAS
jgi:hypothetical protein